MKYFTSPILLLLLSFTALSQEEGNKILLLKCEKYNYLTKSYEVMDPRSEEFNDYQNKYGIIKSILFYNDHTYELRGKSDAQKYRNYKKIEPNLTSNNLKWTLMYWKDKLDVMIYSNIGNKCYFLLSQPPYRTYYSSEYNVDFQSDTMVERVSINSIDKLDETGQKIVGSTPKLDINSINFYTDDFIARIGYNNKEMRYYFTSKKGYETKSFTGMEATFKDEDNKKGKMIFGYSKSDNTKVHINFITKDESLYLKGGRDYESQSFRLSSNDVNSIKRTVSDITIDDFKIDKRYLNTAIENQKVPNTEEDYDKTFTVVQIPAEFPGGISAWSKFLERNLNRDLPVDKGAPPGKYTVVVSFIVEKNGTIRDVSAENNPGYGTAEEALRIIKIGPNWKPAMQNDRPVIYRHKQSITFIVSEE